ncbi:selenocysteine-specific translation elongation factor [Sulfurovum sp.]|uniref:selenocysteine-specific translation elongation factor n=1 Tax=Sulfurovum sp. TaxID=1969726 RepID=UPI002635549B|nr:selenocysteine-specific translation elongation factor [Sulfurovum sp.]
MSHLIVGTCGHIDHGKTALIKALNGFEGDTLKEEKARGITIDLSFSSLGNGEKNISFIDVPGHEKLVKHMISGAFSFDAVLIAVSAAEGVMPQTLEHLEILKLLGVRDALLIVTKKDLVPETALAAASAQIEEQVAGFGFNLLGTLAVSIYDAASVEAVKKRLFALPARPKVEANFFRLYVDRVFSLRGVGTVVTGSVLGKPVSLKDTLFICNTETPCRIRNIQVHNEDVGKAELSSRVALNLAGVNAKEIKRGYLLIQKGYLRGFGSIDIFFETLGREELRHNRNYTLYIGAMRSEVRVTLFEGKEHAACGFATLKSCSSIFSIYGEKLILREGNRTVAGARVLNPVADPLRRKQKLALLEALKSEDFPQAYRVLLEAHKKGLGLVSSAQRFALSHEEAIAQATVLKNVFVDEKALVLYPLETQAELAEQIGAVYEKNRYALLSVSSIRLRMPWASEGLIASAFGILEKKGVLKAEGNLYKNAKVTEETASFLGARILERLREEDTAPSAPFNMYDDLDIDRKSGDRVLKALCVQKSVVRLSHNLFICARSLGNIVLKMRRIIQDDGYIEIANFKAHYPLSRKYLVAYLEYLDHFSDIRKEGNRRFDTSL